MRRSQCSTQLLVLFYCVIVSVEAYYVEVRSTGSSVVGGTINFTAVVYDNGAVAPNGNYMFNWIDDTHATHHAEINSKQPYSNWSVTYPINETKPGSYKTTLKVDKDFFFWINIATNHVAFELTESLEGEMVLLQNGTKRKREFVSTKTPVNHTIALRPSDAKLLAEKAVYIQTYWFQNCTYLGVNNGLSYQAQYLEPEENYKIEALVVASFEKLPDPTTTTTTTTTTSTTSTTTTTTTTTTPKTTSSTTTTTTTPKPSVVALNGTQSRPQKTRRRRDAAAVKSMVNTAYANALLLGINLTTTNGISPDVIINTVAHTNFTPLQITHWDSEADPPYDCASKQIVARDPNKLYGYFGHNIISKSPVSDFSTSGQNWLQRGDMLRLQIKCKGSPSLKHCISVFNAPYNATGNETCLDYLPMERCEINYTRYFYESKAVLFFIRNDVSEMMNQVTIKIYEAKVQSQLSVVVVPVSFTLIAVILIVFGVSYYIQSRNRFTVEVADFNFGETQSVDMEYKTFQQRLIDSIRDAFPRRRRSSEFNSDIEPELDNNSAIVENSTTNAANGNASIDSNLRYNSLA